MRNAAVLARPAVVALPAAVDRLRDVLGAADRHRLAKLALDAGPQLRLRARHRHCRMKAAVRQLWHVLGLARDADVIFDELVVRNEILVADRPILAIAVEGLAVKILIAQ